MHDQNLIIIMGFQLILTNKLILSTPSNASKKNNPDRESEKII